MGEGDLKNGYIAKLASSDGSVVWDKAWSGVDDIYGVAAHGGGIIFAAELLGADKMIDTLGPFNSSAEGTKASAIAVKLDSSGVPLWTTILGEGDTHMIKPSPSSDHVYVAGTIKAAVSYASGALLSASEGGFLAQRSTSDGAVAWAVDTPSVSRSGAMAVSTAGDYVHLETTFSGSMQIGTDF